LERPLTAGGLVATRFAFSKSWEGVAHMKGVSRFRSACPLNLSKKSRNNLFCISNLFFVNLWGRKGGDLWVRLSNTEGQVALEDGV